MLVKNMSARKGLRRSVLLLGAASLCWLGTASAADSASDYPNKPIRMLHGYASGSSMDINARAVALKLSDVLGQPVVVEARPGATGTIASEQVARAEPDGYTLLATPASSLVSVPHMQPVRFDPLKDFQPISTINEFSYLLVANDQVPFDDVAGLIAAAKKEPGKLNFGTTGTGSAYHLAGEQFALSAGIDIVHLPYRGGGAAALSDLLANRIQLMWNSPAFLMAHVKSGKLKALGVTGSKRIAALPDVPTIAEAGIPGYDMSGAQGIYAPAGTPRAIVDKLHAAIQESLKSPEIVELWAKQGMGHTPESVEEFEQQLPVRYEYYGKLIKSLAEKLSLNTETKS